MALPLLSRVEPPLHGACRALGAVSPRLCCWALVLLGRLPAYLQRPEALETARREGLDLDYI